MAAAARSQRVRVVLLAGSPMYYQASLYRRIAAHPTIDFTAVFASNAGIRAHDPGYGMPVVWDADALSGFRSVFLKRADRNRIDGGTLSLRDLDVVSTIRRLGPDVLWLHGYNSLTHVLGAFTQRLRRGHVLFREEQTLMHPRPVWKSAIKHALLRILFRDAAAAYIGSNNREWFEHYGMSPERLLFAPYCVDNERFLQAAKALESEKAALRRSFGLDHNCGPVILMTGRLVPKKQPLFLLEVFRRLRRQRACGLLIAGSGPLQEEMTRRVREQAIPNVAFTGFLNQSEIERAYAAADIFALPSIRHETWGLVVNEALNFALPAVVSSSVGSARDLVRSGENGYVLPATDIDAWVDRLRELVDDGARRREFGEAGRNLVQAWNYDRAAEGILAAVAMLTNRLEQPQPLLTRPRLTRKAGKRT